MLNFAARLIRCETLGNRSPAAATLAAFRVCEKLHAHMATMMGNTGFRALLGHALALATVEIPWLGSVRMKIDGAFAGLEELQAQIDADELHKGGMVLLAQLLGLLVAFIGERLTLRLVSEVWPKLSLHEPAFNIGKLHENSK